MEMGNLKFFTLDRANEILPKVKNIVEKIVMGNRHLFRAILELQHLKESIPYKDGSRLAIERKMNQIASLQWSILENHRKLLNEGVFLRDISVGGVDFPTIINGDIGYFCWRLGEDEIMYWHPIGGEKRQRITPHLNTLKLKKEENPKR